MSKGMGLSFLSSLSPITSNAWNQINKLGGEAAGRMFAAKVGSGSGIKSWWSGKHLGFEGGKLGWGGIGSQAEQAATMGNRRFTAKAAGALGAMNVFVGDDGFMGFAKGSINTGVALSAGYIGGKPLWNATSKMGRLGKWGVRGAALAGAGYWAGGKLGIL